MAVVPDAPAELPRPEPETLPVTARDLAQPRPLRLAKPPVWLAHDVGLGVPVLEAHPCRVGQLHIAHAAAVGHVRGDQPSWHAGTRWHAIHPIVTSSRCTYCRDALSFAFRLARAIIISTRAIACQAQPPVVARPVFALSRLVDA